MYHRAAVMQVDDKMKSSVSQILGTRADVDPRWPRPRSRRKRNRRLIAAAIFFVILVCLSGVGAYGYTTVKDRASQLESTLLTQLQAGQSELQAAKTSLEKANSSHDEAQITQAKVHFANARAHFIIASQTADHSTLLRELESVPGLGPSVTSRHIAVDGVATMGIQLSLAGDHLSTLDGELIKPAGAGQEGQSLLKVLEEVQGDVGPLANELMAALEASNRVDISVLPAAQQVTFARARGTISVALDAVKEFKSLVPTMTELLGGNGPRNYLIEQVNPAELRPGGGFIGTYSVLKADKGALSLIKSGPASELIEPRASIGQAGYVAPPMPFENFIPGTSWSFIDSNFFSDFAANAEAAEAFVQPRVGHIDGVIAIDYYSVARILEIAGPIQVPGFGITLNSQNFIPLEVQYDTAQGDLNAARVHYAILSATAGPLLQRIVTLQASQWPTLIGAFNELAASRNLQTYFNNADVEKTMTQFGWSGVLNTTKATDYMMEIEANLGGTKANYFITRHYTVELTRIGPVIHHKVSVDITDTMPYSYVPHEYYHAYIQMLMSGKADSMSSDLSIPHRQVLPPAGTKLLDGWINLHGYGHDRVVTFNWNTPWQPNGRGVEQIYWQKQPGTPADKVDVTWNDGNGHIYKVSGDLAQDRVITLAPNGISLVQGQLGTAQLPSLSLG